MSWFGGASSAMMAKFNALIDKATDEAIPFGETDLETSLEVADLIRSKAVAPKDAMRALKKKLTMSKNPNTLLTALHLIDLCVKNGGTHFIVEISSREFIDSLVSLIHNTHTHQQVAELALSLIQSWAVAFRDNFQFKYVVQVYDNLKKQGYEFLPLKDPVTSVLFDSSAPPEWEDSDACMICSTVFSMLNRKHHCRHCGGVYCSAHSSHELPLPSLGITDPVRVCDNCYDELHSKSGKKKGSQKKKNSKVYQARADYDSDEDEDLKKALELSLKESQANGYVDVALPEPQAPAQAQNPVPEDEEDEDLKAAIAASLKDMEPQQTAQQLPVAPAPPPQADSPYASLLPQAFTPYQPQAAPYQAAPYQVPQYQVPQHVQQPVSQPVQQPVSAASNRITPEEANSIRQFAIKTEEIKSNPSLYFQKQDELNTVYKAAVPLTPKLSSDLNDSMNKYNQLTEMNSKIDTVMRLYNKLLDERIEYETSSYAQQQQVAQQPSQPHQVAQVAHVAQQHAPQYQESYPPAAHQYHSQPYPVSPPIPTPQHETYELSQPYGQYEASTSPVSLEQSPPSFKYNPSSVQDQRQNSLEFSAPPIQVQPASQALPGSPQALSGSPQALPDSQQLPGSPQPQTQSQDSPTPVPVQPEPEAPVAVHSGQAQPGQQAQQEQRPKITDVTFPTVPLTNFPQHNQQHSQQLAPQHPQEANLIDL